MNLNLIFFLLKLQKFIIIVYQKSIRLIEIKNISNKKIITHGVSREKSILVNRKVRKVNIISFLASYYERYHSAKVFESQRKTIKSMFTNGYF